MCPSWLSCEGMWSGLAWMKSWSVPSSVYKKMGEAPLASSGSDAEGSFAGENRLVLESWILLHAIGYQTVLSQDSDSNTFILMKAVLDSMESLLEHQGQMRGFSTLTVRSGRMNSTMIEVLCRLMDKLMSDQKRLESTLRPLLAREEVYGESVIEAARSVASSLEKGVARFENDLLLDENIEYEWRDYFQRESATTDQVYAFARTALQFVQVSLQQRYEHQQQNFYRQLAEQFNSMVDQMRNLLAQVTDTVQAVANQAGVVDGIARKSSSDVQQQQETDQVATAIIQMMGSAQEAARAGEQGRGFAVNADEVRTLAKRTQDSTAEIESMILRLQSGVGEAVKAMEISHDKVGQAVASSSEVGRTLEHIAEAVSRIVEINTQVASAGEEQDLTLSRPFKICSLPGPSGGPGLSCLCSYPGTGTPRVGGVGVFF